ncbi:MAG: hypothetical protein NTX49_05725 [Chlamydiae bacterium]|nr:hypothetical protein [Chlamydiota bacterium]
MANKQSGSDFEKFLKEKEIFEECNAKAVKRVITFQLEKNLKNRK